MYTLLGGFMKCATVKQRVRKVANLGYTDTLNRHQPTPLGPSNSAVSATVTGELNRLFQIPHHSWP